MKTIFILGITCALIMGSVCIEDIQIGIRVMNINSLEITCFGYAPTVAMVKIFRGGINFKSVIKIITNDGKCDVSTTSSESAVHCICESEQRVVCNVSDTSFNSERDWKCAAINYQDPKPKYSRIISLPGFNDNDDSTERTSVSTPINYANTTISNQTAYSDITTALREIDTSETTGFSQNTLSEPFLILLATSGCLVTLLVAGLICSFWKRIRNTGPDLPPVVENNYLTALGETPRTSQYVIGRDATDHHDNVALRHINNIAFSLQGVITARVTRVDRESRTEDEKDSANNYDSISDTTPEMPYAEIPT